MIWAKRRFAFAEYSPYFERMEKMLMDYPAQYREFIMVSTKAEGAGQNNIYVGVPNTSFLAAFNGFEEVSEAQLPKVIDTLHIADATTDGFKSRFTFKERR